MTPVQLELSRLRLLNDAALEREAAKARFWGLVATIALGVVAMALAGLLWGMMP